jgi:hypothetical protein
VIAMKLSEMFAAHLRRVRRLEKTHSTSRETEKVEFEKRINKDCGIHPSAPSAPVLVPLDASFVEGCYYRQADAVEAATRLDLYVQDAAGPWRRTKGVLVWAGGGLRMEQGIA